jgi:hypothetical protein
MDICVFPYLLFHVLQNMDDDINVPVFWGGVFKEQAIPEGSHSTTLPLNFLLVNLVRL